MTEEVKRDENGKRHFYVSKRTYFAFYAIAVALYGLVVFVLTSVFPDKTLIVLIGTWCAGYCTMYIVHKMRKGDKS